MNRHHHYLWRAVDQGGYTLDILTQFRRDEKAVHRLFSKLLQGLRCIPRVIVTDRLKSHGSAMRAILPDAERRQHKGLNHRAELSYQSPGSKNGKSRSVDHTECLAISPKIRRRPLELGLSNVDVIARSFLKEDVQMKVSELIAELEKLPPDALVCIYNSYYQEYDTVRKGVLSPNSPFIGHSGVHYPVESWYWDDRQNEDDDDVVITVTDCVGIR